jgi:hypothetical protein
MRAQLDTRQREQVVDQPRHAPGLRLHDVEEAAARLRIVAGRPLQRVDEAGQRGQRRTQLVADIGDEIGAHLIHLPDRREIVHGDDHDAGAAAVAAGECDRRHERLGPARRRHARGKLDALRLAGGDCGPDRLHQLRHAQRDRGRLAAAQRRSERDGAGVERQDASILIEQHHRIRHSGNDGVKQRRMVRRAGKLAAAARGSDGLFAQVGRAQQPA